MILELSSKFVRCVKKKYFIISVFVVKERYAGAKYSMHFDMK